MLPHNSSYDTSYYGSNSDDIWGRWSGNSTSASDSTVTFTIKTTASSSTTSDSVWNRWIEYETLGSGSAEYQIINSDENVAWVIWNETYTAEYKVKEATKLLSSKERNWQLIDEEKERRARSRERRRRTREMAARNRKLRRQRDLAEKKSKELLEIIIGKDQMKIYEETGRIFVKGKDADYHIVKGNGFNIRKIKKDSVRDMCVHLVDRNIMPETDNVLALLLNIRADEKAVMSMANDQGMSSDRIDNLPRAACAGC